MENNWQPVRLIRTRVNHAKHEDCVSRDRAFGKIVRVRPAFVQHPDLWTCGPLRLFAIHPDDAIRILDYYGSKTIVLCEHQFSTD